MNIEFMNNRFFLFRLGISFVLLVFVLILFNCSDENPKQEKKVYLNHNDTVKYVGMETCKACHLDHYETYIRTGMGLSYDRATRQKSASVLGEDSVIYDRKHDLYYHPFWTQDSVLKVCEYRIKGKDTIFRRTETVTNIVGSGQHTNSHMFNVHGYFYQIPFTYYTQQGRLDFPPGFEHGANSRFSRIIALECISCHNDLPDMVLGSENKYTSMPNGITCERCHGPGEVHVKRKLAGEIVDTSQMPDYSIVNPGRLSKKLLNDLCARCHLQGTTVIKEGKDYYDFRPGMEMTTVMDVFQPWYEGGKESFIMASHYERMTLSKCYLESGEDLSCLDCHNPHVSHTETPVTQFNNACLRCHKSDNYCSLSESKRMEKDDNCVACHMRLSETEDIPHVRIHDHRISVPPTAETLKRKRVFKGLKAFNNWNTDSLSMAMGYLREYESYTHNVEYLDSAYAYLQQHENNNENFIFNVWIDYYFLKKDFDALIRKVEKTGISKVLKEYLTNKSYNNYDAWAAYRTGQAYDYKGHNTIAKRFYRKAVDLAPFNMEFQNKYGSILVKLNELAEAKKVFEFALRENPKLAVTYVNLGYLNMLIHKTDEASKMYEKALALDPDHLQALINLAGVKYLRGKKKQAGDLLRRAEKLDPGNMQIKRMLQEL
jgi:predicted CXXCH cytochrome family protein